MKSMPTTATHYETLGLAQNASPAEIRGAYRRLARRFHPDVDRSPDAGVRFAAIANAYEILNDPEGRRVYDLQLAEASRRAQSEAGFDPRVAHYNWSNIAGQPESGAESSGRSGSSASRRPSQTEADEIYETFFTKHNPNRNQT